MLKIDISKAFDTLQWEFIQSMLEGHKFPPMFIKWTMGCVTGSWFTLKINGSHHGFFKGKSGVRQGDPLSPFLFVLSMEVLSRQLRTMCNLPGVSYHPKCSRLKLTHLVFADDLMLFTRGDLPSVQQAVNILDIFST
ncbi:secreted RxLR effector protein 78-like [Silene latifolia]|uniref:secreted RxLR effector protein 78-like n=1 Tax=Silene latifolia TaxID=37657 RepID=UPI003D76B4D1